jgi:uncharacterized protein YggT (Ycf19 family)
MRAVLAGIDFLLEIYCWIAVAVALSQLLKGFWTRLLDNRALSVFDRSLTRVMSPPFGLIRRVLPDLGQVDLSPVVFLMIVMMIRYALALYAWPKFASP